MHSPYKECMKVIHGSLRYSKGYPRKGLAWNKARMMIINVDQQYVPMQTGPDPMLIESPLLDAAYFHGEI